MTAPGFWDNQETAQEEVEDLKTLNQTLKPLEEIVQTGEDLEGLIELCEPGRDMNIF